MHACSGEGSVLLQLCIHFPLYLQSLRVDFEDREARLRTQEKEMKQRDTEINRLLEELRKSQVGRMGDTYNSRTPIVLVAQYYYYYDTAGRACRMENATASETGKHIIPTNYCYNDHSN